MKKEPLISVVMPVYNAELYIKESIESILKQSFSDFEFIIINDGSIDRSHELICEYKDVRICYVQNEKNLGLVKTLNKGISLASGQYIARMDADDIAHPERFLKQIDFLKKNPSYGVVGTNAQSISKDGLFIQNIIYPETNESIKKYMIALCPFGHFSVMIRKSVLVDNNILYRDEYKHAEDCALWVEIAAVSDFYNLQDLLMSYRSHDSSVSIKYREIQRENRNKTREKYINKILFEENLFKDFYNLSYNSRVKKILKYKKNHEQKYLLYHENILKLMYLDGLELISENRLSVAWSYFLLSSDKQVIYLMKEYLKNALKKLFKRA